MGTNKKQQNTKEHRHEFINRCEEQCQTDQEILNKLTESPVFIDPRFNFKYASLCNAIANVYRDIHDDLHIHGIPKQLVVEKYAPLLDTLRSHEACTGQMCSAIDTLRELPDHILSHNE
ncbi:hypothetical protein KC901_02555 [Patescibacteria group bacterium]|nr:hypothetical protein [Patescibacteria group bacterium]